MRSTLWHLVAIGAAGVAVATASCTGDETASSGGEATCGDGVVRTDITDPATPGYEECDDGNLVAGDGCDASCATEPGYCCMPLSGCVADGETDPSNPCRACETSQSTTAWTNLSGTPCEDGDFCDGADECQNGACVPLEGAGVGCCQTAEAPSYSGVCGNGASAQLPSGCVYSSVHGVLTASGYTEDGVSYVCHDGTWQADDTWHDVDPTQSGDSIWDEWSDSCGTESSAVVSCGDCATASDCDDQDPCNGTETCDTSATPHVCRGGTDPLVCSGSTPVCLTGVGCVQCTSAEQCDDHDVCNGTEQCSSATHTCTSGAALDCPAACDSGLGCVECKSNTDCNDGLYCNGVEVCNTATHTCVTGTSPCNCGSCDEASDSCGPSECGVGEKCCPTIGCIPTSAPCP